MSEAAAQVRDLRGQMRAWRRGRADTRLVDALGDAYIAVFATLMLGSIAVNLVINVRAAVGRDCVTSACEDARTALPWLFAVSVVAACLGLCRLFGPMLVSPAVGSWLLNAPIDRGALLRPRLAATGALALLLGSALTAAGAALAGFGAGAAASLAATVGALCLAAVGFSCLAQAWGSSLARLATWLLAALVWAGLVLLASGSAPTSPAPPQRAGTGWLVGTALTCLLAVTVVAAAAAVLHRIHRDRLTPGGSLVPGLSGALSSLDFTLVYDILLARQWLARSTVRVVRGRGSGIAALVWRDVVRLRRNMPSVVVLAASSALPYLAGTLGLGRMVVPVAAATGFFCGIGLFAALRVTSRTPSLVRCLPLEGWVVKAACLLVPGGLLLLWGLGTAPDVRTALHLSWPGAGLVALAVGVASVAAVTRWMTGGAPDYSRPLVTSPMGAVPTSLYTSFARGFDVLLLLSAPLLISPTAHGAEVSIILGAVVTGFLVGRR